MSMQEFRFYRESTVIVILENTPTVILERKLNVIPEILYQELKVTCHPKKHSTVIPNLIGDPGFFNPGFPLSREWQKSQCGMKIGVM